MTSSNFLGTCRLVRLLMAPVSSAQTKMALSITRSIKNLKVQPQRTISRLARSKQSYKRYGTYASTSRSIVDTYSQAASTARAQVSKWWAALTAAPVAAAAFWGTSVEKKNDLDTLLADAQAFEKAGEEGSAEELHTLASKMIATIRGMPDSEFNKHPEFVVQVAAVAAAFLSSVGSPEASGLIEYLYQLARRIDAENKYPDALRLIYRADFAVQAQNQQFGQAKKLLLSELELVRKIENTSTSMDQSDILFYLAVICASDGDANAARYLQETNKLFNGVTTATLSPDLENYWRMSILQQLQYAFTLEAEGSHDMAKHFHASSKTLYDGFKKVSPNKQNVPEYRELEIYAKMALQKQIELSQ